MERVLTEARVDRSPVPPESSYLAELSQTFWQMVGELIARGSRALRLDEEMLAWIVAGMAVLALALILWALLPRLRRARPAAAEAAGAAVPLAPALAAWDAADWRAELERCLAEERIGEALRAAWWWLARTIAGPQAQPDWTSRDLLARTRQRELRDLLRRLDLLTYGPARPGLADLHGLAEQLRGVLG